MPEHREFIVDAVPTAVGLEKVAGTEHLQQSAKKAGRPLSTGEIIGAVGSSRPTVTKQLRGLENEGLVRWNGKSSRDLRATCSLP